MSKRRRYTARHVGRTRERLAELLVESFAKIGEQCESDPSDLMAAQGRWRSDWRMDVYRWEGRVRLFRHGKWDTCSVDSWSTMTDCVRFGITVEQTDIYGRFEAFANDDLKSFRKRRAAPAT